MKTWCRAAIIMTVLGMLAVPARAQESRDWSFTGVDRIGIDGTSGDIRVEAAPGTELEVTLRHDVEPRSSFRPEVQQRGSTLRIEEHWSGSSGGSVDWTVRIPASLQPSIDIDTASGDLEAAGVEARFRLDTASGDVRLSEVTILSDSSFDTASGDFILSGTVVGDDVEMDTASGDVELRGVRAGRGFEFDTASGDVVVEDSRGVLAGSTASGDVHVDGSVLDGASSFSSASGNVVVRLDGLPEHDMELSSASGDVRLDAGFGPDFTLVMSARQDRGEIDSPFPYTSEETYQRGDHTYMRKTVAQGSGRPEIRLHTASGTVKVRER